jgi:hypothetical protein
LFSARMYAVPNAILVSVRIPSGERHDICVLYSRALHCGRLQAHRVGATYSRCPIALGSRMLVRPEFPCLCPQTFENLLLSPAALLLTTAGQVEDLARISFKHKPLYVGVDDGRAVATREGLEQGYCVVPADKKFLLLFTFLKKNANKKVRQLGCAWRICRALVRLIGRSPTLKRARRARRLLTVALWIPYGHFLDEEQMDSGIRRVAWVWCRGRVMTR